jgi:hypothetical protein
MNVYSRPVPTGGEEARHRLVAQVSKERMHLNLETDHVEAPHDRLGG